MVEYWTNWVNKYPIFSIDDGLHEDDWASWTKLTKALGSKVQLVGDDLVRNKYKKTSARYRRRSGQLYPYKSKSDRITTETIDAVNLATRNGFTSVMSHRLRETEDTTIGARSLQ